MLNQSVLGFRQKSSIPVQATSICLAFLYCPFCHTLRQHQIFLLPFLLFGFGYVSGW
jgi:hypothetical protein